MLWIYRNFRKGSIYVMLALKRICNIYVRFMLGMVLFVLATPLILRLIGKRE